MIEYLQKLSPEIVEIYIETRDAKKLGISQQLADYILQINEASNLNKRYSSITECARQLQKSYPKLSIHTCKKRIYDAINYLNSDCTVTSESWYLYFADMHMKLFEIALVSNDLKEAKSSLAQACEYRIKASENAIDPNRIKFKPQIVSPDIELERMGINKQGVLGSYKKALTIIHALDTNDTEKKRLIQEVERELNVNEASYEEL